MSILDLLAPDLKQTPNSEMIGPKLLISLQYRDTEQILKLTIHRARNLRCGEWRKISSHDISVLLPDVTELAGFDLIPQIIVSSLRLLFIFIPKTNYKKVCVTCLDF